MTYGELRDSALKLINQYSIAGVGIPPSYNNQADYIARIPSLVNAALTYISTSTRFIPAQCVFDAEDGESFGVYRKHALPENYWQMRGSGLLNIDTFSHAKWTRYRMMPPDHILIDGRAPRKLMMEYYRKPELVKLPKPDDDQMIDGDPEVQQAVVYYVAAHLVMYDDHFEYASLKNEFENMMDRMAARPNDVEIHTVEDVYGFGGDW